MLNRVELPPARRHNAAMSGRPLAEYVDRLLSEGGEAFREGHRCPVLVSVATQGEDEQSDFHTAIIRPNVLSAIRAAAVSDRSRPSIPTGALAAEVHEIKKKGDRPFHGQIGVGRARNVDVCLPLARLSKYHGYFSELEGGGYAFTDAGSTNGTLVNGVRLERKVTSPLQDGVEMTLGPYRFVFYGPDAFCEMVVRRAQFR
jgi:hypothetical protein